MALNGFPARVAFVNQDGTLTREAILALNDIVSRIGDNGDVFAPFIQAQGESAKTDTVTQGASPDRLTTEIVTQPTEAQAFLPDVMQPASVPAAVATTAAPAGGTGTAAGGYDTAGNRDAAITLLNTIRTALIGAGILT